MKSAKKTLEQAWYGSSYLVWLLLPLSWLFCAISILRRKLYQSGLKKSVKTDVPLVIIGNIVVGGSGKTPLLIALCDYLIDRGYRPGVVSRGYGGSFNGIKQLSESDPAELVGDEPAMIKKRTGVPLVVGADRAAAVEHLLANNDCDVVLSDDGLQHYRMQRSLEIAVIDAERGLGNGFCLPAGPLRERKSRLAEVDIVVLSGGSNANVLTHAVDGQYEYQLEVTGISRLGGTESMSLEDFVSQHSTDKIHAVAGIGHPLRFFTQMRNKGLTLIEHGFADHHHYQQQDFSGWQHDCIIMTEKDAVKCQKLDLSDCWQVSVQAVISDVLKSRLDELILPLLRPS
jgi:tetraacyldisaccharide 4'-kinase